MSNLLRRAKAAIEVETTADRARAITGQDRKEFERDAYQDAYEQLRVYALRIEQDLRNTRAAFEQIETLNRALVRALQRVTKRQDVWMLLGTDERQLVDQTN